MPVAYELRFKGGTLDQYDRVLALMGLDGGHAAPPGALFHWVTEADGGLLVVDVWEDDDAFQRFSQEQIGPYTQQVGIPPPEVTRHEVYNYMTAGG